MAKVTESKSIILNWSKLVDMGIKRFAKPIFFYSVVISAIKKPVFAAQVWFLRHMVYKYC